MPLKSVAIVGGGIIGLSIAYKLILKNSKLKVTIFEKENDIGLHQSGRNSGVLHCGLAYNPGSLKAKLAKSGIEQMTEFCSKNGINHEICGKVVIASTDEQIKHLDLVASKGHKNGLQNLKFLTNTELKLREPNVIAKKALLVPQEGIVDFKEVMYIILNLIKERNGKIIYGSEIKSISKRNNQNIISNGEQEWPFDFIINCTGLHSDKTFKKFTKKRRPLRIIPFRGEYYTLKKEAEHLVNHLVYPVPNPNYPFLGVHFTRLINGEKEVGPNAVLVFSREGYSNMDFSLHDFQDVLTYKGFYKFIYKNLIFSLNEFATSISISQFIKSAKTLIPEIDSNMVNKGTSGVRAQAMNDSGELYMDFKIVKGDNQIHILNAPSPGATASFSIADHIIENYF